MKCSLKNKNWKPTGAKRKLFDSVNSNKNYSPCEKKRRIEKDTFIIQRNAAESLNHTSSEITFKNSPMHDLTVRI